MRFRDQLTRWWFTALLVGAMGQGTATFGQVVIGKTPADWPAGITAPIAIPLPPGDWAKGGLLAVVRVEGSPQVQRAEAQYEPADPVAGTPARGWIMWAAGPVDRGRSLTVQFEKSSIAKPIYQTHYMAPSLTIATPDTTPILSFFHGNPEAGQRYPLTDFIHPLMGMDGEPLTTVRPQDHEHHRGIYWAWVRHERDGKSLGNWWQPSEIRLDPSPLQTTDGPLLSRFVTQHTWIYQPKAAAPQPFMQEYVVCRLFPTTHLGRAMDIEITLTSLLESVRLGGTLEREKGYGGFTFRCASAREAEIVADGKRVPRDLNQLRASWADYSGIFMKRPGQPNPNRTGAAIMVEPHHPDFPPEWITRLYGVLNVSYPGLRMLDLPKAQPLRLRYRVWVHRGDAAAGQVEAIYKAFAADWDWHTAAPTQTAPAK